MTVLKLNQPFADDQPTLVVENKLAIGEHVIRLVVVDNDGQESDPLDWALVVREGLVVPPVGPPIPVQPPIVSPIPVPPIIRTVTPGSPAPSTDVTRERQPTAKRPRRARTKSTTPGAPKSTGKTRRKSASKSSSEPSEKPSDTTAKRKSTTKRSRRPRRYEQDT